MTRDSWIGVVVLAAAALFWVGADGIRVSPLDDPIGAAGLPKALAYCLGTLAILLIVRSLAMTWALGRKPGATAQAPAPPGTAAPGPGSGAEEQARSGGQHLRALGMLVLGLGYLLALPYLGYALAIIGLLLAAALYMGARVDAKTLAVAGLGGVFFYLLFVQLLHIPLPPGIWPDLLRSLQG